jgi:16S rRNA U516 pseudouridylate synthase RsuA-like enzyme
VVVDRPFGSDDISRVLGGERVGMFDPHDWHTDFLSFDDVLLEDTQTLLVTLTEWKKRHIRRLLRHIGYRVRTLERIAIGGVLLHWVQSGSYRFLTSRELLLLTDGVSHVTQAA